MVTHNRRIHEIHSWHPDPLHHDEQQHGTSVTICPASAAAYDIGVLFLLPVLVVVVLLLLIRLIRRVLLSFYVLLTHVHVASPVITHTHEEPLGSLYSQEATRRLRSNGGRNKRVTFSRVHGVLNAQLLCEAVAPIALVSDTCTCPYVHTMREYLEN